ncbi:MAG TPA: hypothetical protein DHM37_09105 [Candidatus Cloacimonas sp.]|nr:hypothetical protein [Candidatus Cloacimonadota bacterium]HCX73862.1 hypothetical protein [Candidatus Cloacimonas sp.]
MVPNQKVIKIFPIKSGHFWADAGSVMGILPKSLWQDKIQTDSENRVRLDLNQLLIQTPNLNILVDTGLGDIVPAKIQHRLQFHIEPLELQLQKLDLYPDNIDIVLLTHLHYDHAAGVFKKNGELKFKNAQHFVQKKEWLAANDKTGVDATSYKNDFSKLEKTGQLQLINGHFQLTPKIRLELVKGHSAGLQVVRIETEKGLTYFASDLFPLFVHKTAPITAAADICRQQVYQAKKQKLKELRKHGGRLYFGHQPGKNYLDF